MDHVDAHCFGRKKQVSNARGCAQLPRARLNTHLPLVRRPSNHQQPISLERPGRFLFVPLIWDWSDAHIATGVRALPELSPEKSPTTPHELALRSRLDRSLNVVSTTLGSHEQR